VTGERRGKKMVKMKKACSPGHRFTQRDAEIHEQITRPYRQVGPETGDPLKVKGAAPPKQ